AAEALVGDVLRDQAVRERDRFVLKVDAAALEREAGSAERVGRNVAVLEDERSAGWAVGAEGEGDVGDAAAAGAPACAGGVDRVPADGAVAQRRRAEEVEAAAADVDGAVGGRGVDVVVADQAVADRALVEDARAPVDVRISGGRADVDAVAGEADV